MYLLDTTVPSGLRKKDRLNPGLWAWATSTRPDLQFISAITILELRMGAMQREMDDPVQARSLHRWLDNQVLLGFADRVLNVTLPIAERCASLHIPTQRDDRDMLIAATALVHDFTVVTRNVRHFQPTGVKIINPWS